MKMSIIIPTCNRNNLLINCLDRLHASCQKMTTFDYEVIVTDDSQNNIARNLIKEKYDWVTWVEGPKRGPAANRNNAARYAKGEWLAFTDDDCLPTENWMSTFENAIKENAVKVYEGRTNADRQQERFDEESPINLDGGNLWSCNFVISKDLFNSVGGFDEDFPYAAMEDMDLQKRLLEQTTIMFLPDALVIHPWRRTKPLVTFKKHLKSFAYYSEKHGLRGTFKLRWSRTKIFVGGVFYDFKTLVSLSMKGWPIYIERCILNFCLIFV